MAEAHVLPGAAAEGVTTITGGVRAATEIQRPAADYCEIAYAAAGDRTRGLFEAMIPA